MRIKENVKPLYTKLCNQIDLKQEGKLGQCGAGMFLDWQNGTHKRKHKNTPHLVFEVFILLKRRH